MEFAKARTNDQAAKVTELPPFEGKIGNQTPFILVKLGERLYLRTCWGGSHAQAMNEWRDELARCGIHESWITLETGWATIKKDGLHLVSGSGTVDPPEYQSVKQTHAFFSDLKLKLEQIKSEYWEPE